MKHIGEHRASLLAIYTDLHKGLWFAQPLQRGSTCACHITLDWIIPTSKISKTQKVRKTQKPAIVL